MGLMSLSLGVDAPSCGSCILQYKKKKKKIDAMDLQVAILRNSSLLENLGKSYFPSMLWLHSTASTIASHLSSAIYDYGYSFFVDSFQRLAIMAPLRV